MIFKTAGVPGKPIILMIPAMFMSYSMYNEQIKLLMEKIFKYMP